MMQDFKEINLNNISELNKAYLNKMKSIKKSKKPNSIVLYVLIVLTFIILFISLKFSDEKNFFFYIIISFGVIFIVKKLITSNDSGKDRSEISISSIYNGGTLNTHIKIPTSNTNIKILPTNTTNISQLQPPIQLINTTQPDSSYLKTIYNKKVESYIHNNTSTYNENFDVSSPKRFVQDIIQPNISYNGLVHGNTNTTTNAMDNNNQQQQYRSTSIISIYNNDLNNTHNNNSASSIIDNNTINTPILWHTYQSSPIQDSSHLLRYPTSSSSIVHKHRYPINSLHQIQSPIDNNNDKNSTSFVLKEMIKRISSPDYYSTSNTNNKILLINSPSIYQ